MYLPVTVHPPAAASAAATRLDMVGLEGIAVMCRLKLHAVVVDILRKRYRGALADEPDGSATESAADTSNMKSVFESAVKVKRVDDCSVASTNEACSTRLDMSEPGCAVPLKSSDASVKSGSVLVAITCEAPAASEKLTGT